MMDIESRGCNNNQVRTSLASSFSNPSTYEIGRTPVTLISIERTSKMTQLLQPYSNYEFTQYPQQRYRRGRDKPDPLEVVKTISKQNNKGSMLVPSTIHPQNGHNSLIDGNQM